jgi:hyperosmotically inducible periplasmic protein
MTRQKFFGLLGAVAMATTMTAACAQSDAGVTTAVKSKFSADDTVKAHTINVDTKDRVVTLKGEVDSDATRARAVTLARTTEGVRDVVDALVVTPKPVATTGVDRDAGDAGAARDARDTARATGALMGDAGITTAVKTKLLADTVVGGLDINVDTKDAIVTLTGEVASSAEKRKAVQIARDTDNVKSVKDNLKIVKK